MKKGQHMTDEMKQNLRNKKLGKKLSPEHRAKVIKTLCLGRKGEENPNWKGGVSLTDEGYVLVRIPEHPDARSNGYYPEHRLVMEHHLGRLLRKDELVHHKNEDKTDNRIENLELLDNTKHLHLHWDDPIKRAEQSERISRIRASKFWSTKKKLN